MLAKVREKSKRDFKFSCNSLNTSYIEKKINNLMMINHQMRLFLKLIIISYLAPSWSGNLWAPASASGDTVDSVDSVTRSGIMCFWIWVDEVTFWKPCCVSKIGLKARVKTRISINLWTRHRHLCPFFSCSSKKNDRSFRFLLGWILNLLFIVYFFRL